MQLFTQHRFEHLRCLELIAQDGGGCYFCPQTDACLLPLVKPADMVVSGRLERQAARAAKRDTRGRAEEYHGYSVTADGAEECDGEAAAAECDIPAESAASFAALECLALPYWHYNNRWNVDAGKVSDWIEEQLTRSYEYE